MRAACCCTVTQVTSTAPTVRVGQPASIGVAPSLFAIAPTLVPAPGFAGVVSIDRPRAQGDPPDTLFARRCSLLL